jgi:hypothetical protein
MNSLSREQSRCARFIKMFSQAELRLFEILCLRARNGGHYSANLENKHLPASPLKLLLIILRH